MYTIELDAYSFLSWELETRWPDRMLPFMVEQRAEAGHVAALSVCHPGKRLQTGWALSSADLKLTLSPQPPTTSPPHLARDRGGVMDVAGISSELSLETS